MINPKSEGFKDLLSKCKECALCDPGKKSRYNGKDASFGCELGLKKVSEGGCSWHDFVNFVPYVEKVEPVFPISAPFVPGMRVRMTRSCEKNDSGELCGGGIFCHPGRSGVVTLSEIDGREGWFVLGRVHGGWPLEVGKWGDPETSCKAFQARKDEKEHAKVIQQLHELEAQGPHIDAGKFCTVCGTPYDSSEMAPKAHVPKWARGRGWDEQCMSCAHARRILGSSENPCANTAFKWCTTWRTNYAKYKPRISRAERKRVSLAGQLKAANAYIKVLEERAKEMSKHHADTVAMHEKELAASVPLANAIQTDITTMKVDTWNYDNGYTAMCQVLEVKIRDGKIVQPKDLVLFKKEGVKRQ